MTTTPSTAAAGHVERVTRIFDCIGRQDLDSIRGLLHETVELDLPFQLPGHPRAARGADAVLAYMASIRIFDGLTLHIDSHLALAGGTGLVVRYRSDGIARSTGRVYRNSYVGIFEFDDALLSQWTEFHNPVVFCEAFSLDPLTGERRGR
jgi:ketosteroid isomerase-like protein